MNEQHLHAVIDGGIERCIGYAILDGTTDTAVALGQPKPPAILELPIDVLTPRCSAWVLHEDDCRCDACEREFFIGGACYEYWDFVIERWEAEHGGTAAVLRAVRRALLSRMQPVEYSWVCFDGITAPRLYRQLARWLKGLTPYERAFIRASLRDAPSPMEWLQQTQERLKAEPKHPSHYHVRFARDADTIDEYIVPAGDDLLHAAGAAPAECTRVSCRVGSLFSLRRCRG